MLKKFMLIAFACLSSGAALAQTTVSCVQQPSNPLCFCLPGENDADCTYGVHRGLVSATTIHDSVMQAVVRDRAVTALHLSK